MDLVYRQYGVQSHRPCPDCLKWMVLYMEVGLAYYRCPDPACNALEVATGDESRQFHHRLPSWLEDNDTAERKDLQRAVMTVGIYHAERLAARLNRPPSFTEWVAIVKKYIGDEIEALGQALVLPQVWNSNIMQYILKMYQPPESATPAFS